MKIKNKKSYFGELPEVQTGDILIVNSNGFLPYFIRKVLKKYKPEAKEIWNHTANIIKIGNEPYTVEMLGRGTILRRLKFSTQGKRSFKIKRLKEPLTKSEQEYALRIALDYCYNVHGYQFINFFQQLIWVKWHKWIGFKNGNSRTRAYCSELSAIWLNEIRNVFDGETYNKNPMDIDACEALEDFYHSEHYYYVNDKK